MTRMRLRTLSAVLLVSLVVVPLTASAESAAVSSRATVKVAFNKKLKKSILVDGRGLTLYMYLPTLRANRPVTTIPRTTAPRPGPRC